MDDLHRAFLEQIRRGGVTLTPELAAAFAGVPREAFVAEGFRRSDGGWARPGDDDFRPTVYHDDVLVTKVAGRIPVSSSSQPSLMALMIEALDVRPGLRILEIGAGTGYNAALLAALGASVTSVDVQKDVADRARSALADAQVEGVRVVTGDGYAGFPGGRFDRVIVTVGVAGLSPLWLDQLEPDGVIVAPVDHAGMHPVLAVRRSARPGTLADRSPAGPLTATMVCHAGFMTASGPLTASHPGAFPAPADARELAELTEFAPARFDEPLEPIAYRDLWYAAGVWDRRSSHAAVPGVQQSCLALLDEAVPVEARPDKAPLDEAPLDEAPLDEAPLDEAPPDESRPDETPPDEWRPDDARGGAVVLPDGSVLAGGAEAGRYGAAAVEIVDRWVRSGRPAARDWQIGFGLTGDPTAPIWVPDSFSI
jgi:protein-L-isoaspartate(D-aspartate) O-methyltransferase